jgi:ABC-2 type transport system permease protein
VNPLLMMIVYAVVFSIVMRIKIPNYPEFLLTGLLGWNMFASAVQSSIGVIIRQSNLVKKIYFPREILPLSVVGGSLINYIFSLVILVPLLLLTGYYPTISWAYLPLIILVELLATVGFSLMFSAINVFLRDFEHIMGIIMMLWFYLTPVIYALNMVPKKLMLIFELNPVTYAIVSIQDILYYHRSIQWNLFMYGLSMSLLIFIIGIKVFSVLSTGFAEEV